MGNDNPPGPPDSPPAEECPGCDPTPYFVVVTFKGVVLCPCANGRYKLTMESVNDSYLLTQDDVSPCLWWAEFTHKSAVQTRHGADCLGPVGWSQTYEKLHIYVEGGGGIKRIVANLCSDSHPFIISVFWNDYIDWIPGTCVSKNGIPNATEGAGCMNQDVPFYDGTCDIREY